MAQVHNSTANGTESSILKNKESTIKFISPLNSKAQIPEKPSKCTWHRGADPATSPHTRAEWRRTQKILPNVTRAVGNTPLVRLNKIPQSLGIKCEVLVKCEYFNPGGSIKDRIGFRMIEDAEKAGLLKPGSTIIEPTSGNTGIGLALGAAVKGYRCIIVMSEKMSNEKVDVLRALGAEVVRTPISAASSDPDGLFGVSYRLKSEIPNSLILDQYSNPGNPLAHYDTTAEEIFDQCDGKVDMIVAGAGTGGSITGIGRKFKEISPQTVILGVDPYGSILAEPEKLNQSPVDFYEVEGLGYDFIPTAFDRSVVDKWVKIGDKESLTMARRLIKEEGFLCGGSSGAALAAAVKEAADLKADQRVVVILPDSIRNYLTKFISDPWMEARNLKPCPNTNNLWWWDLPVEKLEFATLALATTSMTCDRVLNLMKKHGIDQVPVMNKNGGLQGVMTMQKLLVALTSGKVQPNESIEKASILYVFPKVTKDSKLGLVSRVLERDPYVVVVENQNVNNAQLEKPVGVITAVDVLQFISGKQTDEAETKN